MLDVAAHGSSGGCCCAGPLKESLPRRALGVCKSVESSLVLSSCLWVFPFHFFWVYSQELCPLWCYLGVVQMSLCSQHHWKVEQCLLYEQGSEKWLKWTEQTMKFTPQSTGCWAENAKILYFFMKLFNQFQSRISFYFVKTCVSSLCFIFL